MLDDSKNLIVGILVNMRYPKDYLGMRDPNNQLYEAELREQPDHVLEALYASAMEEKPRCSKNKK